MKLFSLLYLYILIVYQVTLRDISTFSFITIFWGATRSSFISLFIVKIYRCKLDNFWWKFDMRLELKQTNYLPRAPLLSVGTLQTDKLSAPGTE